MRLIGLVVLIVGLGLTARNFRDRSRVGVLHSKLRSPEFLFLVAAVALTAMTFIVLAFLPLRHEPQSIVLVAATYGGQPDSFTMPFHLERPNLFPGGNPQTVGDVFRIASLLFVLLPVGLISLPLFMKRSRFRGVGEGVLASALGALCMIVDFSTGLIVFVPPAAAMLAAAAFSREKSPSP